VQARSGIEVCVTVGALQSTALYDVRLSVTCIARIELC